MNTLTHIWKGLNKDFFHFIQVQNPCQHHHNQIPHPLYPSSFYLDFLYFYFFLSLPLFLCCPNTAKQSFQNITLSVLFFIWAHQFHWQAVKEQLDVPVLNRGSKKASSRASKLSHLGREHANWGNVFEWLLPCRPRLACQIRTWEKICCYYASLNYSLVSSILSVLRPIWIWANPMSTWERLYKQAENASARKKSPFPRKWFFANHHQHFQHFQSQPR